MFKNNYVYKIFIYFLFFIFIFNLVVLSKHIITGNSFSGITHYNLYSKTSFNILFTSMLIYLIIFSLFINKEFLKIYNFFLAIPYLFILLGTLILLHTDNIMVFFLAYEMVLLPSAILVFLFSPNKRSFLVTLYFLLWTQLGSFLVLISSLLLYNKYTLYSFNQLFYMNFDFISPVIPLLLLIGFGIKIPVWPFHFWLTKTHVEANTSFSIFLSGVLVKTALIGLIKFNPLFTSYTSIFLFIVFFGVIDATFKLYIQTDFKKLIAFLTVQEMSVLLIISLFLDSSNIFLIKFSILHTFLSGSLFYFSELIYSRRGSRQLQLANGFLNDKPLFSFALYTLQLLFIGLPFTLKFFIEISLILKFLTFDFSLFIFFFLFLQFLTIFFFFKNTIFFFFGKNTGNFSSDLSIIESLLLILILTPLIFITIF